MPAAFSSGSDKRRLDTQDRLAHEANEKREKRITDDRERKRVADALNLASEAAYPSLGQGSGTGHKTPSGVPSLNYRSAIGTGTSIATVATSASVSVSVSASSSLFPVYISKSFTLPAATAYAPQSRPAFTYVRAAYAGKEDADEEYPEEGEGEGEGDDGDRDGDREGGIPHGSEGEMEEGEGEFNSDISGGRQWGGKNSLY